MKKTTRITAAILAGLSLGAMSGCGGTPGGKRTGILEVNFTIAGYGDEYAYDLAEAFTEETGIRVKLTFDDNATNSAVTRISSVSKNTTDLFFTMIEGFPLVDQGRNKNGYDNWLKELSDLYAMEVPGKGKTLGELVRPDLKEANRTFNADGTEGQFYMIPWSASLEGLICNKKVLDIYEIEQLPRTTDEWEETLDLIKAGRTVSGGIVAPKDRVRGGITCANNSAYWEFVWPTWWAQYDGAEGIDNYFAAKPEGAGEKYIPDWQALTVERNPGKKIAVEELERFLKKSNGYMDPECENRDHLQSQVDFLDGKSAFVPSGAWIETETAQDFYKEGADISFVMMRTPVTSRLCEKYDIMEEELRAAIDYADGVTTEAPTFDGKNATENAEILAAIVKARGITSSGLTSQNKLMIPAYSQELEEAYQFVLFYASDKGQEILASHGVMSAFGYEAKSEEALTEFNRSMFDILGAENTTLLIPGTRYPICYKAGLTYTAHRSITSATKGFENLIYKGEMDVNTICSKDETYYKDRWSQMLVNAGYGR